MLNGAFSFGLANTISKAAARAVSIASYLKDNLKIYFDFKNTDLEHVGTGSASFDGTGDYITYNDSDTKDALEGIDELTVMGWCRRLSEGGTIICKGSYYTASTNWGMEFQGHSNNRWRFSIGNSFTSWSAPPDDITDSNNNYTGTWHHYALTYNKNAAANNLAVYMYIDGKAVSESSSGTLATISSDDIDITIGANNSGGDDLGGNIKNCGVWNRILTQEEIQNVMYKSYADLKGSELTHLQFWANLDSDLHAKNNAGNSITGTASNQAAIVSSLYGNNVPIKPRGVDNSKAALADQIGSGSASFDGSDDYIDCGDANSFSFGDGSSDSAFSVTAWIKMDSATKFRIIGKTEFDTKMEWLFGTDADDDLRLVLYDSTTSNFISQKTNSVLVAGQWYHLAATYSGNESNTGIILYANGAIAASTGANTGSYTAMHSTSAPVMMGQAQYSSSTTDNADGNIAQIGVFNAVLTQEQIQSIKEKSYSELTTSEKLTLHLGGGLDSTIESSGSGASFVYDLTNTTLGSEELANNGFESGLTLAASWTNMDGWVDETVLSSQNANATLDTSNARTGSNCMKMELLSGSSYLNYGLTSLAAGVYRFSIFFRAGASQTITSIRLGAATGLRGFALGDSGTISSISETYSEVVAYINNPSSQNVRFTISAGGTDSHFLFIDDISIKKVNGNPGELI